MSTEPRPMPTWTVGTDGCIHPQDQIGSIDVHSHRFVFYCNVCKKRLGLYNQKNDTYEVYAVLPPMGKLDYS